MAEARYSGDKARDVFLKSRLPVEKLSQIWYVIQLQHIYFSKWAIDPTCRGLADSQKRGALETADFAVGMHLIQAAMSNSAFIIPKSIPPAVFEQAGKPLSPVAAQSTGGSIPSPTLASYPGASSTQTVKPQYTGSILKPQTPSVPLRSQYTGTASGSPSATSSAFPVSSPPSTFASSFASNAPVWDITPAEKAKSDSFFKSLDSQGRGYIEGDVAVQFMLESKLSEQVLAQIWYALALTLLYFRI